MTNDELFSVYLEERKAFRDKYTPDNCFVCGCITYSGSIFGHHGFFHTPTEKTGISWRWNILDQDFADHIIPPARKATEDENKQIVLWLYDRGFASESTMILFLRKIKERKEF